MTNQSRSSSLSHNGVTTHSQSDLHRAARQSDRLLCNNTETPFRAYSTRCPPLPPAQEQVIRKLGEICVGMALLITSFSYLPPVHFHLTNPPLLTALIDFEACETNPRLELTCIELILYLPWGGNPTPTC